MQIIKPSLFGLNKSNRDFTNKNAWGKNQFNSSFPTSLCCYLAEKNNKAVYLSIEKSSFKQNTISISNIFGISPQNKAIYFAFESTYTPFQKYLIGTLPRTDLVIQNELTGECLSALEIKLTALPDNTTCDLEENNYGSELVVRPDTIVYLACSIASCSNGILNSIPEIKINDWSDPKQVLLEINAIIETIVHIAIKLEAKQQAFLLQPIWKTQGKSPDLMKNCLDVFVWSNAGFTYLISQIANKNSQANEITRATRTAIWLFKMLSEIKHQGKFDHKAIIDTLSFNTKNDKAFAVSGKITNNYMKGERLLKPVIEKHEIKNIILGGGQNLLSPERRFDAIVFNSPELFK